MNHALKLKFFAKKIIERIKTIRFKKNWNSEIWKKKFIDLLNMKLLD